MKNMTSYIIELCKDEPNGVLMGNVDELKKLGIEINIKKSGAEKNEKSELLK